jgi:Zn-dependent protease with chaperone function
LYFFLATAVCCVGASAGELFFLGYAPLSNSFAAATNRCLLAFPVETHSQQLDRCWAGAYRSQGWLALGWAVGMLVLTVGLILIVPWLDRWRLARAQRFADIQGWTTTAAARFRSLCAEVGLAGPRCPDLLIAAVPHAFTTVLPGGRPLVVLPVKVALGRDDPRRFDPVVLHELAHVRMRDVSLASAVRGIAWITIPVMALASLPELFDGGQVQVQTALLVQAGLFIIAAILVAAALLRFREFSADRQAALWLGSSGALSDLLDNAGGWADAAPRDGRWWLRPLARHPSLAARRTALHLRSGPRDASLAYGFAVGAVAAMAMETCFFLAGSLDQSAAQWLPVRAWAAAGGVLLGVGLAPALLRDAARPRQAGTAAARWEAATGTGLGLLLGSIVPPGSSSGAVTSIVVGAGFSGVATAVILALGGAGLTVLIAGLASVAAERFPRQPAWLTACLAITVSGWVAGALEPVRLLPAAGLDLNSLGLTLASDLWRPLLLLYPATVVLLVARMGRARATTGAGTAADRQPGPSPAARMGRKRAATILYPAIAPVGAAACAVALFLWHAPLNHSWSVDLSVRWIEEAWLVCALAGWVVLISLVLAKGLPGLARACVSAWSATVLAAIAIVVYGTVTGWPGSAFGRVFREMAIAPSVWLFFLAVPTSLVVLLPVQRLATRRRRWLLPAGVAAGAAAVAVLVFATGVSSLVTPPPPPPFLSSPCGQPGAARTTALSSPALDANQVLTNAAAHKVIDGVCTALPVGWVSSALASAGAAQQTVIRPDGCAQLADLLFLNVLGRPLTQVIANYRIAAGAIDGSETLTVIVDSLARPVPSSTFAVADTELASCPRYAVSQPAGTLVWTAHGFSLPETGARTWGADFSTSRSAGGRSVGESRIWAMASIGRDLIFVGQTTITLGIEPPPDRAVTAAAVTASVAAFRQSALGVGLACREFRTVTLRLSRELIGGENGWSRAQRADFRAYGAAVTQFGELVGRSGSHAALVAEFERTGTESGVVGRTADHSKQQTTALSEVATVYPLIRKACIALQSWPK